MRPARIAYIGQRGIPATIGGIEHHVEEIGSRLAARGHQVTVYTRGNYSRERIAEHRGMRVRYMPTVPTKRLEALVHSGLSTAHAILPAQEAADILHYHAIGPSVFTPVPRLLTSRRVVVTIHGLDHDREKWGFGARTSLRAAGWITAHVPHATITVSRDLADYYLEHYGRPAHHIPNGVAAPVTRSPRLITERWGLAGEDYLLFLGRLVPEKAPDLLVRAFRRLETTTRLVLAGGSSFTDGYVRHLQALASADPRVIMAGEVGGELRDELYTNAAAFVLPSNLEGLPLTLLEAASYRLPLIASDIPPHLEVVGGDTPGGRLFRRGDETALNGALAAVLGRLPVERAGAMRLADRVVREYDWDVAADATEELYASLLARRSSVLLRAAGPPRGRSAPGEL
ncbi:MAG: glycosyltransferase family 4 protein [Candidatus Dormibacteria bacterium]|jgi:glycosyltransferase involved in cell wall biosynthesis